MDSRFKIYSASAGSGKTFNLALEYLTLCLKGHEYTFREILAITFTNKAADEMKSRILNYLYKLSINDSSNSFLAFRDALVKNTQLSPDQLSEKARKTLFAILHDFSAFYVITIDSFFVQVFRSFSADLLISSSRKPSIDQELLEDLALDDVLSALGINTDFTNFFQDYLRKQFSDPEENDINPLYTLRNLIQKVSKDASYQLLLALKDISYEDFKTKIEQLRTKKTEILLSVSEINQQIKNIFQTSGIQQEYCSRGTLYKLYFEKLSSQPLDINKCIQDIERIIEREWREHFKKDAQKFLFSIDKIQEDVINSTKQILNNLFKIQFIDNILSLSSLLVILRDAENSLNKLSDEENLILLSDISRIINEHIRQESGDFIYEKIGNRFKHIFIDEFQDTSKRQWQNMYPLIVNALSIDGSVKLIGDPKQSIYRFRNADSKQMLQLINNQYLEKYPITPQKISLNKNFRSAKNIVEFNNKIFTFIRENYRNYNTIHQSLADVVQQASIQNEGYVEIKKFDQDQYNENTLEYVASIIQNKVQQGYQLRDIAILVRNKQNGRLLANSLINYHLNNGERIEVTSSESFLLKGNPKLNILINTLRVIDNTDNKTASIELLYDLMKSGILSSIDSEHSLLFDFANFDTHIFKFFKQKKLFPQLSENPVFEDIYHLRKISIDELINLLIKSYNFGQESDAFIAAFVDLVYDYCNNTNKVDITSFLHYWDNVLNEEFSINTSSTINAVQIMTIHKAKGLEWPVVILPFFDFKMFKTEQEIIELEEDEYFLKSALVKVRKSDKWPKPYEILRNEFIEHQLADNLNLMYVAMTRAKEEMFISIHKTPSNDEISNLLHSAVSYVYGCSEIEEIFVLGDVDVNINQPEAQSISEPTYIDTSDWRKVLKIAPVYSSSINQKVAEGSKMHALLSTCYSVKDFEQKLETLDQNDSTYHAFKNLTETIQNSEELRRFYSADRILNERKILVKGQYFVPDSMAINGNKISILEYKTGVKKSEHFHQLKTYMRLAADAGYLIDSGYLIYVNHESVEFEKVLPD
ncbi:ATP-dependent helicase [Thermaurantimonas aggregans]|uniref:DNA 3'-5' helicase n=1 Tax=Thermaurantimonas aggregans TaxID=2173829 RepID=A0A401XND0_9FLAO|nr:UvrD-helicase domain-containing protein [Thermaurantimonas aggregans]GCD78492.1 ATP-dependent helicase [Thermaurantimonas aggregans]